MKNKSPHLVRKQGFTMVELLVVIVILGILSVLGMGAFQSSQMKSRDSRRKSDLKQISGALEMYYNDHLAYPASTTNLIQNDVPAAINWGTLFNDSNGTVYMVILPQDPQQNTYYYASTGTAYQLYALLENEQDRDIGVYAGTVCLSSPATACNYGISSSNITP